MLKDKELSMVSGANLLDDGVSWFKENPVLGTVICVAAAVATAGAIYYVAGVGTAAGTLEVGSTMTSSPVFEEVIRNGAVAIIGAPIV